MRFGNTRPLSVYPEVRSRSSLCRLRYAFSAATAVLLRDTERRLALFFRGPRPSPSGFDAQTLAVGVSSSGFDAENLDANLGPEELLNAWRGSSEP